MQVFIPYKSPYYVACVLDPRRLNKQILECSWILDSYEGKSKRRNHPIYAMYENDQQWLRYYMLSLKSYRDGNKHESLIYSYLADEITPTWMSDELCNQHKRRLVQKDPEYYHKFAEFGSTTENWYIVDNGRTLLKYDGGLKERISL